MKSEKNLKSMPLCMASMHLFAIYYLLFVLICSPVFALELDTSVDDEIRKNYNPNKIEEDMTLPALPKILNNNINQQQPNAINITSQNIQPEPSAKKIQPAKVSKNIELNNNQNYAVLKKGTKIKLKLLNNISDKSPKGTKVSFISTRPVTTTYFTIPMGTIFKGEIVNSHGPQFAGNGGLIVININSIIINDETQPINAYVTKANSKLIFLNNIKGKRKYLSSMAKSTKNGRHYFSKMMRVSKNLAADGSSIVIVPFSIAAGVIALGGNILVAPALALFHKGGSVSAKSGSEFEVKLIQDVMIYN